MIVLITGDRNWENVKSIYTQMKQLPKDSRIVHGYANGADMVAHILIPTMNQFEGFSFVEAAYPSHWRHNEPRWVEIFGECPTDCKEIVGRPAGVIRNGVMLEREHPELVLAFHPNLNESKGTRDMVTRAKKAGIEVRLFTE